MSDESKPRSRRLRVGSVLSVIFRLANVAIALVVGVTVIGVLYLRDSPPPTSAFMELARREDPATGKPCEVVEYVWMDRENISPHLPLAVVVAEDQRFLLHDGFDLKQIRKAVSDREANVRQRGASTISQQVSKNLFLWPSGGFFRKGIEAWLTLWIEWLWEKERILEVYVNVAQFGPCTFGAEAASQKYFGRPASELEPAQAALLATVLPNPARLRAWNPGPYAQSRRDEVLALMAELRGSAHLRGL